MTGSMPPRWAVRTAMSVPMLCGAYVSGDDALWTAGVEQAVCSLLVLVVQATSAAVLLVGAAAIIFRWRSSWVWRAVLICGVWLVVFETLGIHATATATVDWESLLLALSTGGYSALIAAALLWPRADSVPPTVQPEDGSP